MRSKNILHIVFDPDFKYFNDIKKLKAYHEDCLKVLNVIQESDADLVNEKIKEVELLFHHDQKN